MDDMIIIMKGEREIIIIKERTNHRIVLFKALTWLSVTGPSNPPVSS